MVDYHKKYLKYKTKYHLLTQKLPQKGDVVVHLSSEGDTYKAIVGTTIDHLIETLPFSLLHSASERKKLCNENPYIAPTKPPKQSTNYLSYQAQINQDTKDKLTNKPIYKSKCETLLPQHHGTSNAILGLQKCKYLDKIYKEKKEDRIPINVIDNCEKLVTTLRSTHTTPDEKHITLDKKINDLLEAEHKEAQHKEAQHKKINDLLEAEHKEAQHKKDKD
jgi:hypothetical protein